MANVSKTPEQKNGGFVTVDSLSDKAAKSAIVLVPGVDVPILALDLPKGLRGSAREKVSQRLLQDQLGLGPDQIEFRPFDLGVGRSDWCNVIAANAADVADWRQKAGKKCRAILPDYLALPAAPDIWSLSFENDLLRVRIGLEDGFSCEAEMAELQLKEMLGAGAPKAVLRLTKLPDAISKFVSGIGVPILETPQEAKGHKLTIPRVLANGEERFDLLKDPRAERDRIRRQALPWVWSLAFGLVAASLWAAALWLEAGKLQEVAQSNRAEALAITRDIFVQTGPILDIRTQTAQALAGLQLRANDQRQKTSPMDLFSKAIQVLDRSAATINDMGFNGQTGLVASVKLRDFGALDDLVLSLEEQGIDASIARSELDSETREVLAELPLRRAEEVAQ